MFRSSGEGCIDDLIGNAINVGSEVDPDFYTNTASWDNRNSFAQR